MDLALRNDICPIFDSKAERYGLDLITRGSFSASFGYRNRYCAADVVLALRSVMENVDKDSSVAPQDLFLRALDSLSRSRIELLEEGIFLAKCKIFSTPVRSRRTAPSCTRPFARALPCTSISAAPTASPCWRNTP